MNQEEFFRGKTDPNQLSNAVFEIATRANDHLITANTHLQKLKDISILPFVPIVPHRLFLQQLEKKNFNLLDSKVHRTNPLTILWKTYLATRTNKLHLPS